MSQKYFTTLTNIGAALHANAQLQQTTVPWTHLVLGDGNGVEPVPSPAQTGVIREVDRLAISSIETDPNNPNWIVIEAVIPADRGGYVVRETALMGTAGGNQCIAVGNYPSATKPLLSEGAGSELVIRMVVEIAHTATVTLKIDPAVVIASRDWVEKQHATQQKRGLVRLATMPEALLGEADDIAVTPAGVMRLVSEISADSGMVVISAGGVTNWVVPDVLRSGKKKVLVKVIGGGAGGAGGITGSVGSGGGGGGVAEGLVDLTGIAQVVVTIGAGGAAGASLSGFGADGGAGGATSFGGYMSATGGVGGEGVKEFGNSGGRGGVGVGGALNTSLGPGGASVKSENFGVGGAGGGPGGRPQHFGVGGPGVGGEDGIGIGGGGAGAVGAESGGAGRPGAIVLAW